jgi:hypothetical protein
MSAMRSVHPVESKEVASLPARLLTQMVIGTAAILMFTPFVILF